MNWLDSLSQWSLLVLLWVGTPIQFLFVVLYFTRTWRKYPFSRALMYKSASLGLYLFESWSKAMVAGLRPYDWPLWIDITAPLVNGFVFWAILNQLRALVVEMAEAKKVEGEVR